MKERLERRGVEEMERGWKFTEDTDQKGPVSESQDTLTLPTQVFGSSLCPQQSQCLSSLQHTAAAALNEQQQSSVSCIKVSCDLWNEEQHHSTLIHLLHH
ncbi:unnamed protein product [Pleuronectes platessa]|uniref:Uncharacterized protein n=1 Tax=Pleuronectes platessa TaxID=8262 RepID=A0A9N7UJ37_PLEPL|nr:unnamed protein product [Pleuronectes platessa]